MDDDELGRLLRDREMLLSALGEVLQAHAALPSGGADRWTAALKQADEVFYDATKRRAGDKHPILYFFCQREGGHHGPHEVLPHAMRVIHAPGLPEPS